MSSLFEAAGLEQSTSRPLADRLRPTVLGGSGGAGRRAWPGRAARADARRTSPRQPHPLGSAWVRQDNNCALLAGAVDLEFMSLSAVFSGVADLRKAFEAAKQRRLMGQGTLLFVDEIHRFNRAQQDGFLPYVEDGTVVLVGATTENPSFELNSALLSRCQVLVLSRLDDAALETLIARAEGEAGHPLPLNDDARAALKAMADGDGRYLLNLVDELARLPPKPVLDAAGLAAVVQKRAPIYDKSQEGHYNLISALHKSMRGSDPDAALYWFARMISGGEDPRYIARRVRPVRV